MGAPLPLVGCPGKLPRQELTSRRSCLQFSSPSPPSTPSPSPSPSSTPSTSRGRLPRILHPRPCEGVLSGRDVSRRHPQDCHHHPLRTVRVRPHAVWFTECRVDLPAADGPSARWPALHLRLPRRRSDCESRPCFSSTTSSGGVWSAPGEWTHHQSQEVRLRPGGGQVFGASGFGLRNPPAPWPRGGCCPVSTSVDTARSTALPWPRQFLPPVFARCCRFPPAADQRSSGPWQVPRLVSLHGAGLQRRQDLLGQRRRARAPAGGFSHQFDGRRVRLSRRCCPTAFSPLVLGSSLLLLEVADAGRDSLLGL